LPQLPIQDPRWWLTFNGHPLFLATFAACYGPASSRYSFGADRTYFFFQTLESFLRRHDRRTNRLPESARERIREAFRGAGRPYDLAITLSPLEAERFVKPLRLGDPPVRWWVSPDQSKDEQ
jgi:hypothetical protein